MGRKSYEGGDRPTEEAAFAEYERERLREVVDNSDLSERQRQVIDQYYGQEMPRGLIARYWGVSIGRVANILATALRKLSNPSNIYKLK